jgi:hypothetical protein
MVLDCSHTGSLSSNPSRDIDSCPRFSLLFYPVHVREPGSSVSIVSGYGLNDWAIKVRSPAEAKDFTCSLCVQTGSGAHPASCTMGTGVLSPGLNCGRGATLTTHPNLVPRSRMSRSYTYSPPSSFMVCGGTALAHTVFDTLWSPVILILLNI